MIAAATPLTSSVLEAPRSAALRIVEVPGKGRGLTVATPVVAGTLLEVAPALPLAPGSGPQPGTTVYDYTFFWGEPPFEEAIALGMISLCNHSPSPSARFETDIATRTIRLYALRDVSAGEELTIDYEIPLWFEAKP